MVGVLPYLYDSTLTDQNGVSVEDNMPISVWPARSSRSSDSGESFDHTGEVPLRFEESVSAPNLVVVLRDGPLSGYRFKIVAATTHPFTAHVALELRRVTPGGGQF